MLSVQPLEDLRGLYSAPFVSKLLHETWIQKTKIDSMYISFIQKLTRFLTHKNQLDF